MTTSATSPDTVPHLAHVLDELAWAIERDGMAHHELAVAWVTTLLRASGSRGLLLDLVADPSQPSVARERAFGRVALAALAGDIPGDDTPGTELAAA